MVWYKLIGHTGYGIKVFRRFEVTTGYENVTVLNSAVVKKLKKSIMQEFPGKTFQFSVSLE